MSEITAKNYVGQAVKDFRDATLLPEADKGHIPEELAFAHTLESVPHFVLPDGGVLFNDRAKGIQGRAIKLPFDSCTLEFYMPEYVLGKKQIVWLYANPDTPILHIHNIHSISELPVATPGYRYATNLISADVSTECAITPKEVVNLKWVDVSDFDGETNKELVGEIQHSRQVFIKNAVRATFEFLEAMSCKNVEAVTYQKASPKNAQRIKSHKAPIYETKILSLVMPQKVTKGEKLFGTHASPRQHLRRGHIRRLDTGNIWVNACVVGDASNGIINKQYKVSA